jgi:hypothetical protein
MNAVKNITIFENIYTNIDIMANYNDKKKGKL